MFMNILYKSILVASLTACIANANAIETATGGYIGVGFGKVDIDTETFDDPTGFELIGGYKFNDNLAIEVSYVDFGEASDNEPPEWKITANSLAVGVVGIAPITEQFEVFGKIGFHSWDIEFKESGFGILAEDDGSDIFYSLGANYKVNNQFSLGVSYSNYTLEPEGEDEDITLLSLNGKYYF